ncbi:helix-turn-helix domain-containing protein [Crenobacter caeni]|uniref:Helix-turn-helix transcriptional regulator n=1 Tax=Crenobacter caeni TaxID=2705474 RepID=A0A6B2KUJ8_9NEIS|nr:helix-turn-helix transcriptional regulator [Crenobacter caeni]NDV13808.1 helix-turn-helix transcriptional regulator [Crenobacter caeni]
MPKYSPLPERLKAARLDRGLTQQQLGILLDMDPNSASARMSQYETGKHMPDYDTMKRMADELGVPVAYFFCENELDAQIIKQLGALDDEQKQALLAQLASLKARTPVIR